MNRIHLSIILAFSLFISCEEQRGCMDPNAVNFDKDALEHDGSCYYAQGVEIAFEHFISGDPLEFNKKKYSTISGNPYKVSRLRYLISNVVFHRAQGEDVRVSGYHFVRLEPNSTIEYQNDEDNPTLVWETGTDLREGSYSGISFTFGFPPEDNVSGEHGDLNQANWSWPDMLGGGYHHLQLEGEYDSTSSVTKAFNAHLGTARDTSGSTTIYKNNHFRVHLDKYFEIEGKEEPTRELVLRMDVNKWFERPPSEMNNGYGMDWDMREWPTAVMPNYQAQRTLNGNGRDVFSFHPGE